MGFKILEGSTKRLQNISDEDYFGDAYKEYVSNSSLRSLNPDEGGSAFLFKNRVHRDGDSLELGTAIHRMVLEGDKYVLGEVEKPSGKLGKLVTNAHARDNGDYEVAMADAMVEEKYYADALTEERIASAMEKGRAYFDFLKTKASNPNMIVLTSELRQRLQKSVSSIKANKDITGLLSPSDSIFNVKSFSEDVIISEWTVEVDGRVRTVGVKGKIDSWSIDFDNKVLTLNDLKTTGTPIQAFMGRWQSRVIPVIDQPEVVKVEMEFVKGSFQKWHYYRQMAMYLLLLKGACADEYGIDLEGWTINVNIIVAETITPFNAYSFEVNSGWLKVGEDELADLLYRYAWHETNGWDKIMELQ